MFNVVKHLSRSRGGFGRRIFLIASGLGIAGSFAYRWWREQALDLVERPRRFPMHGRSGSSIGIRRVKESRCWGCVSRMQPVIARSKAIPRVFPLVLRGSTA